MIEIKNLHVAIEGKEILKDLNLTLEKGEVLALMGPNGSGKTTLANVLMGNPKYEVTSGEILFNGESVLEMEVDERAKKGIFMSFQHPSEIPGVTLKSLLRASMNAVKGRQKPAVFAKALEEATTALKISPEFVDRYVNDGFSGGEKKRAEILQLLLLSPKVAILDETDSGLDVDALRTIGEGIRAARTEENAFLIITHYPRILEYVAPDRVVVLKDGMLDREGGPEVAKEIEEKGFE